MKLNKKGFTLIEVITVVAIISILSIILVPNVNSLINKNKIDSCNSLIKSIEKAASIYVSDNRYNLTFSGTCDTLTVNGITLQTLIDAGTLKGPVVNPIDQIEIDLSTAVNITYSCQTKQFAYEINGISCEL